jgi:hypothetical protein
MPRFAPAGAKKDRAERLAREAKEAKKRTMASQQSRRHQTAESYQNEGTVNYSHDFWKSDSHDFVMYFATCCVCFNTSFVCLGISAAIIPTIFDILQLLQSCLSLSNGKRAIGTIRLYCFYCHSDYFLR